MSQELTQFLSSYYNTAPQPSPEEVAHAQQIDFFAKTAAANGIDLNSLNQEQINWLWNEVFTKQAEDQAAAKPEEKTAAAPAPTPTIDKEAEAKKKAEAEFLQKKEAMAKIAEADFLGRVMAHSLWDESSKIAAAKEAEAKKQAESDKEEEKEEKKEKPKEEKAEGGGLRERLMEAAEKKEEKEEKKEGSASAISEFDIKAAQEAVQKVASSNYWNVNEAVDRLNAVLTLGAKESVKVASAPNVEAALDIRALELLELAGYPIKWEG